MYRMYTGIQNSINLFLQYQPKKMMLFAAFITIATGKTIDQYLQNS